MADVKAMVRDPEFQALPWKERHQLLTMKDPEYAALPSEDQAAVMNDLKSRDWWQPAAAEKPQSSVVRSSEPPVTRDQFIEQVSANSDSDKRMYKAGTNRMFGKAEPADVQGIATSNDRTAAQSARTFVKEDIPAIAKTAGAKLIGGAESSLGGMMQAYGEENTNRYNVSEEELAQSGAGRLLNRMTAADDAQRAGIAQRGMNLGNEGRAVIQAANEDQPIQTRAGRIVDSTVQSIGANAPGMAASIATGNPAIGLTAMGLQTFGQTYDESRAKGLSVEEATQNAAIQGGTEVATEMLPFLQLSKFMKPGKLSTKMLHYYLSEVPGEQVATAVQNATGKAFDHPGMTSEERKAAALDYLASNAHAQDQIDTFFTTILQSAVLGGAVKVAQTAGARLPSATPAAQPAPSGPLSRAVSRVDATAVTPQSAFNDAVAAKDNLAALVGDEAANEIFAKADEQVAQTGEQDGARYYQQVQQALNADLERAKAQPATEAITEQAIVPERPVQPVAAQPLPSRAAAPVSGISSLISDSRQQRIPTMPVNDGIQGAESDLSSVPEEGSQGAQEMPAVWREDVVIPQNVTTPQGATNEENAQADVEGNAQGNEGHADEARNVQAADEGDAQENADDGRDEAALQAGGRNKDAQRDEGGVAAPTPAPVSEVAPAEVLKSEELVKPATSAPDTTRAILSTLSSPKRKSDASIAKLTAAHGRDAVNQLVTSGLISFPGKGMAELTKKGRDHLSTLPRPLSPLEEKQLANLAKNGKRTAAMEAKYQGLVERAGKLAAQAPVTEQGKKLAEVKGYKYKTSSLKHLLEDKDGFDPDADEFHAELLKYAYPPAKAYNDIMEAHKGNPSGVEFRSKDSDRYAFVTPEMSGKGKYRVQYFDSNGFSSHAEHPSLEEAVEEMVKDGFRIESRGALDELSATDSFQNGNAVSAMIGKVNSGEMSWDDFIKRREEIYAPKAEKEWKPSVGDTVYFEDAFDSGKRHPANFRGFNGDNAVVVWNGSQMSLDRKRLFKENVAAPVQTKDKKADTPAKVVTPPKPKTSPKVNRATDDVVVAISKLGGIDFDEAASQWGDVVRDSRKDLNNHVLRQTRRFGAVFKKGGKPLDKMRESLVGHGYLPDTADLHDLYSLIEDATRGKVGVSAENAQESELEREAREYEEREIARLSEAEMEAHNAIIDALEDDDTVELGDTSFNFGYNTEGYDAERDIAEVQGYLEDPDAAAAGEGDSASEAHLEQTDDAGGWQQQVGVEGKKQVPTIGGVQKQGGRRVDTSSLMDGFTPEPPSLFDTPKYALKEEVSDADSDAYLAALHGGNKRAALRILHKVLGISDVDASVDRDGAHSPSGPEEGSPLYDVSKNGVYPEDVYSHKGLQYYGTGDDALDREAYNLIKSYEGHPNKPITIYRAVYKDESGKIKPGDWVTIVRKYAKEHGEGALNGEYKIISAKVYARDIFTSGDSWMEWGYHPQEFRPEIPHGSAKFTPLKERVANFKARYSTADAPRQSLTLSRVRSSFPNQQITEDNGTFTVTTPSGVTIRISTVGEIEFDRKAAEEAYGREILPGEKPVAEFKPLDHSAVINLTESGVGELPHETFHAAMSLALRKGQRDAVLRRYGNEEKAAAEYQRLKDSGAFEEKRGNIYLAAIFRFFRNLRELIAPTAKGAMQDVASGRVWGRAKQGRGGTKYGSAISDRERDTSKRESLPDRVVADAKLLADFVDTDTFRKKGFDGFDIPTKNAQFRRVFRLVQNDKIRKAVVESIPVDMVDVLRGQKLTPEMLLHNPSMFGDLFPIDGDKPIPLLVDVADRLGSTIARVAAKIAKLPFDAASYPLKDFPAMTADKGGAPLAALNGAVEVDSPRGSLIGNSFNRPASNAGNLSHKTSSNLNDDIVHESPVNATSNTFNESDVEIKAKYSLKSAFSSHSPAQLKAAVTVHPKVQALVGSVFNNGRNVNMWMRTVGTMYHTAEKLAAEGKPQFKAVFDKGQQFLSDVSAIAMQAEALAPDLFPKMGTGKGLFHNLSRKDAQAIADPLFQGTLFGGANPVNGKVFTPAELKRIFGLNDHQIELYRQARAAVDQSLDDMAKSLIAKNAKEAAAPFDRDMELSEMAQDVTDSINTLIADKKAALDQYEKDYQDSLKTVAPDQLKALEKEHKKLTREQEATIDLYESLVQNIDNLAKKTEALKKRGYFPLMRFGEYTVTMKDKDGKVEYFGLFESAFKAKLMEDKLKKSNPSSTVTQAVMGREKFKLYGGMNLEALQLFAEHLGADETAPYQEYLKVGLNNRSAMKRLIHRKGTEGFSEDAVRTLANFIVSNARHASTQYHLHDMRKLAAEIPEDTQGDVQDQAVKLYEYLTKPREEATKLRGYLFFHYLGGSLASGIVNMTQPLMMTTPYLASKTSLKNAIRHLTMASSNAFTDPKNVKGDLGIALRRAEAEGVTAPQEIYQLTAMASNKLLASNPYANAALKAWGGFFSVAEAFNRRTTFIAAYRVAKENGKKEADAYKEATKAVTETQGQYNKGNRPNWGRGIIGAPLFTFKQFSVMYLELFNRLPKRQKAIMFGLLWFMAGLQGLPFAEDAEDIIDTIGQWMGNATNSKQWINQKAEDTLGKTAGRFLTSGVSSVLPLDLQGRFGMQNLIPATGILKQSEVDKGRDVKEWFGAAGGLLASLGDALSLAATGSYGRAVLAASPRAVQSVAQGVEMAATGAGHDKYGRKTVEVTPQEAALKMSGFNPSRIAEESQVKSANMQDINLVRVRKQEIVNQWAYGMAHKDRGEIEAAKAKLRDWNEKNPEMKIRVSIDAVARKAKNLNTTGRERFLKSMPKEMRRKAIDELG